MVPLGTATHAELPSISGAWRRSIERFRWDDRHRRLAAHPTLARCTRADVRRIAAAADEVEIKAGEHLVHRGAIGYWFFLLADGRHVGHEAILGFGPQRRSVVAAGDVRAFVIGRRALLSLVYDVRGLQEGLFPGLTEAEVVRTIRELRDEGTSAWRRLRKPVPPIDGTVHAALVPPRPGRRVGADAAGFASLVGTIVSGTKERTATPRPALSVPMSRRARLAVASVVVVLTVAVGTLWHPGPVVVRPGAPVDITGDVTITGAPTTPVNGRYLVLVVEYERPALAGLMLARLRRQRTLRPDEYLPSGTTAEAAHRQAGAAYRRSRRTAWSLHERPGASVRFRPRPIGGASAGLAYALLLEDLLSPEDLARGRTIAVTGVLDEEGSVLDVAYVEEKVEAARRAGADVVLTPARVRDFDLAVQSLLRS